MLNKLADEQKKSVRQAWKYLYEIFIDKSRNECIVVLCCVGETLLDFRV